MREYTNHQISQICLRLLSFILILFSLVIGCSDSTGPGSEKSDNRFKTDSIGPDGGTTAVTASDGTVCRLTIPTGTLSESIDIKITAGSSPNESMFTALTNSFLLEPEGLEFEKPITIEITIPNAISSDQVPAILHTAAGRPGILLETQVNGQTLSASIEHFSRVTPVVPTAAELELYWDSMMLDISTNGLNEWKAQSLYFMYMIAYSGRNGMYSSIDLTTWTAVLRVQTSGLIAIGSQLCSSGNHMDAESKLNIAINIAKNMPFADLETVAQQTLDNCGTGTGTIVIDQYPDNLSGAGWSLAGPRNDNGTGDVTLLDRPIGDYTMTWIDVSGYITPSTSTQTLNADDSITFSGVYISTQPTIYARASSVDDQARIYINGSIVVETAWGLGEGGEYVGHQAGDSGWVDVTDSINDGNNTFRFWVWNKAVCCGTGGTFEISVDDEIVITREFHEQDSTEGVKYDETVTFDFSAYLP